MKNSEQRNSGTGRAWLLFKIALGIAFLWQIFFLGVRIWSVWDRGDINLTTGGEENPTYAVWRIVQGLPLYTDPDARPYVLNIYNFLFYYTHAGLAKLFGVNGAGILPLGRTVSFLFTMAGLLASLLALRLHRREGSAWICGALFLAMAWISYDTLGWLAVSIRPDAMAMAWAMWGMFFYLLWNRSENKGTLVLSLLCFACAASVKQSTLGIFGGCFVHNLFFQNRRKLAVFFVLIPLLFLGMAYLTQGYDWWLNIFKAPGATMSQVNGFPLRAIMYSVVTNFYLWAPFFLLSAGFLWAFKNRAYADIQIKSPGTIVFLCGWTSLALAVLVLTRNGSTSNHLLEFYFCAALLVAFWITGGISWAKTGPQSWAMVGLSFLLVAGQGLSVKNFIVGKVGEIVLASSEDTRLKREFLEWYRGSPRPGLVICSMYSLPWFSGDQKGEAYIYDPTYHPIRFKQGKLAGDGYDMLVRGRELGTLLVGKDDPILILAKESGYGKVEIPEKYNQVIIGWAGIDSHGGYFGVRLEQMTMWVKKEKLVP